MDVIDGSQATYGDPNCRPMTRWESAISSVKNWFIRQRRKFPYLVWHGDELDVVVTLSQDKIPSDMQSACRALYSGSFAEIERKFGEMGIGFDKGIGPDGRDWEWDWSLKGPISVRFKARATKPELRMERPRPRLVVSA